MQGASGILTCALIASLWEAVGAQVVSLEPRPDAVILGSRDNAPGLLVSSSEFAGVTRVAHDLAHDFGRVLGTNGSVIIDDAHNSSASSFIIAGTLGTSDLIDSLVNSSKLDVGEIQGRWESYVQEIVSDPAPGISEALVVAGSDKRGTIYGLYDISEAIGVSPWHWWADVPVKQAETIYAGPEGRTQGPPSVKYRGIFINDEEQCLTGWATPRFPSAGENRPFTSEFYKLVFELLLRLRANYLWPAMKYSMFYLDDDNGELADSYGIVMGTSHHEPMTRAYKEQSTEMSGPWDWSKNAQNITEFMREGAERTKDWETLYTMGMRGEGDTESPTLTAPQLEEIIDVQQKAISDARGVPADTVPQVWALYKEVGNYYQSGMDVPEDVTLMWTDDNFGNLLRTPYPNETSRAAGAGVYYHVNYVGRPKQYEWINTVQLIKTWEQMHLAYEKQVREIWIVNVGDIKPLEIPASHFLDMAYDMSKHQDPDSVTRWAAEWASKQFGAEAGSAIADILNRYGILVMRRKYEALNMPPFVYSTLYWDEAEKALAEWEDLLQDAQRVHDSLDEAAQAAFYQMILHPVEAGKTVNELYIKTELGHTYAAQRRTSTNRLAEEARAAFQRDADITDEYNAISDGKWDKMMCQVHIGLVTWYEDRQNNMPNLSYVDDSSVPDSGILGIGAQGSPPSTPDADSLTLLPVDPYLPPSETRWLDVFTRANGTFSYEISPNASYVSLTNASGTLSAPDGESDSRSTITVDWDEAPDGLSWVSLDVRRTDGNSSMTAYLPVNKTSVPSDFSGFVESNGVVSMEAAHYSRAGTKGGASYVELPFYGRTHSGVKIWPVTIESQTPQTAPALSYDFYSFTEKADANLRVYLGGSRNHDGTRPLRYAFSIDDSDPTVVEPVPSSSIGSDPVGWNNSVIVGGWNTSTPLDSPLRAGAHSLDLWLLEPGVVVQKIVVDIGGIWANGLGPPESYRKGW